MFLDFNTYEMTKLLKWVIAAVLLLTICFAAYDLHEVKTDVVVDTGTVINDLTGAIGSGLDVTGDVNTGAVSTGDVAYSSTEIVTKEIVVEYEAQPTKLAWDYSGNGAMLRKWANDNVKTFNIPEGATGVEISFTLANPSKYDQLPGNIQISVDGKSLCNGRLNLSKSIDGLINAPIYWYEITNITTQDKPKGFDASVAIGKTMTIKQWVGLSNNYMKSIKVTYK